MLALMVVAFAVTSMMAQSRSFENLPDQAERIFAFGNRARVEAGARPLVWDRALAAAALAHCRRMVAEGAIGHRYAGELDLAERAGAAGAHFGVIEENVADAATASEIHSAWMQSPGHRRNLLNPEVDRVGIAVIARGEQLFAVADYARGSEVLSSSEVEARVAEMIEARHVQAAGGTPAARSACLADHGMPAEKTGEQATFVMRWQDAELKQLPEALAARLASGRYHRAAVGSCEARGVTGTFTMYRVAVLLY